MKNASLISLGLLLVNIVFAGGDRTTVKFSTNCIGDATLQALSARVDKIEYSLPKDDTLRFTSNAYIIEVLHDGVALPIIDGNKFAVAAGEYELKCYSSGYYPSLWKFKFKPKPFELKEGDPGPWITFDNDAKRYYSSKNVIFLQNTYRDSFEIHGGYRIAP